MAMGMMQPLSDNVATSSLSVYKVLQSIRLHGGESTTSVRMTGEPEDFLRAYIPMPHPTSTGLTQNKEYQF